MTAEELYEELKKALKYFELSFHHMALVHVSMRPDGTGLIFTHGEKHLSIPIAARK
ncbi:hypothetical protein PJWF_00085 [Achromobacter phage JWF]|uniref:hypothetical protein n=1 Tax=Achromobacter phage JWF TaxID=1589748 RepID=UPI000588E71E|nr:hypothetical protein AXJ13_gp103 [Achromobacter phage JWF]AJD82978.1 hypothetical protein PJWF_00085 [Achromobacter phage JWF]